MHAVRGPPRRGSRLGGDQDLARPGGGITEQQAWIFQRITWNVASSYALSGIVP